MKALPRRLLAAGAVAAVSALGAISATTSARADTAPAVKLKLGQTIKTTYQITGVAADELAKIDAAGDAGTPYPDPDDCASSPSHGCLTVPITLNVPKAYFKTHDLALNITLSWKEIDVGVPAYGEVESQTERGYLWQKPTPKDAGGNPTFNGYDSATNPGYLSQTTFNTTTFFLEIIQTRSQNNPVNVTYSLQDLTDQSFPGEKSYVAGGPAAAPPPPSGQPASNPATGTSMDVGGSAPLAAAPSGQLPVVATIKVPKIKGGAVSPALLAASQVSVPNRLGIGGARTINGVSAAAVTKAKPASTPAELIGLGVLPLAAALLAVFLVARRRRRNQQTA